MIYFLLVRKHLIDISWQWVECDKCKAWQHQICALFNCKRNVGGQAGYTCPKCYLQEIENGECKPLPDGVILGAEDLPRSKLSDHIEQRLLSSLAQERQERASSLQKNLDEVNFCYCTFSYLIIIIEDCARTP